MPFGIMLKPWLPTSSTCYCYLLQLLVNFRSGTICLGSIRKSGVPVTPQLKQNLVNAFSYCLFAGLSFYIWNQIKFHWYLLVFVLISLIVKAIWWHRQVGPSTTSAWQKLLWPSPR